MCNKQISYLGLVMAKEISVLHMVLKRFILTCWLVFPGICSLVDGQQLPFDHITINEGLSNNTVYCIEQDIDGFIWFGTRDGLNRYDGYEFRVFKSDPLDSTTLPSNIVLALYAHPNGDIWIGLRRGGIAVYRRETQSFDLHPIILDSAQDIASVGIQAFYKDTEGNIWVGTAGLGVLQLDSNGTLIRQLASFAPDPKHRMLSNQSFSFVEDGQGNIWIGTDGGAVHRFDHTTESVHVIQNQELYSYRKSLLISGDTLYIGTEGNGVFLYSLSDQAFIDHLLPGRLVRDVCQSSDGRLFISTDGDGLYASVPGQSELDHFQYAISLKNSLNTNAIYDIFQDRDGNIWIGTFNGGLNVIKRQSAPFYNYLPQTQGFQTPGAYSVLSFYQEKNGEVLVGMDGAGIWKFRPSGASHLMVPYVSSVPVQLTGQVITALFRDSQENLWIGTFSHGLTRVSSDGSSYTHYIYDPESDNGITNNNIWDISEDQDGDIWIAALGGGVLRYRPGQESFTRYLPEPDTIGALSDWNVRVVFVDRKNRLWVGTEDGGLNLFDRKTHGFVSWEYNPGDTSGLRSNSILCIFEDADGIIWIGTEGAGLHRFDENVHRFRQFSIREGLQSDVINSIEQDSAGLLWVSTNKGISSVDPVSGEILNFDSNDGLSSDQFNPSASIHTEDGELIFGNIRGANGFYAREISANQNPPRVVFTDFQLFNNSVNIGESEGRRILSAPLNDEPTISLLYRQNVFTIAFAALEFTNPHKNQYAYRMLGFEEEWNYVDANTRRATYTNLNPGQYTFEVRASNNNGVWSDQVRRLQISIAPPFYETTWFRLGLTILILLSLIGIIQFRDARRREKHNRELLEAEQKILQLKNQNLNEEVRQKNAELSAALLQSAHKNKTLDGLKNQLSGMSDQSSAVSEKRSEIRKLIKKIDSELDNADYWEQFQLNFNQIHQQFAEKIHEQHPNLTQNDIRLCCLLKINLTNREIASIQNISISGVEKSKFRLKRKLELDPETDLNAYILGFS